MAETTMPGRCSGAGPHGPHGPLVDGTDYEFDPAVLGVPIPDPPYQYGYCADCHEPFRWDVKLQRLVPWDPKAA